MLRKNPKDPISLFYAAKVKYELGNYEECLTELKKLNDYHPNDPQINFQLGPIYKILIFSGLRLLDVKSGANDHREYTPRDTRMNKCVNRFRESL